MIIKLSLSDIYVERHKILKKLIFKISLHELSRLQTLQKITFFVPDRNVLWCEAFSLGPTVNILAIFSNANVLKNIRQ